MVPQNCSVSHILQNIFLYSSLSKSARVTPMWVSSRLMWLYCIKIMANANSLWKLKEMQKVLQPSPLSPIDEEKSLTVLEWKTFR